jgi:hypothetical protein
MAMGLQRHRKPTWIEDVEPLMKCSAFERRRAVIQPAEMF